MVLKPPETSTVPLRDDECPVPEDKERAPSPADVTHPCANADKCVSGCAAYGKICPCTARLAAQYACTSMRELKEGSALFVGEEENPEFVYLNPDDVSVGKRLGEGGFSTVNQCVLKTGEEAGHAFAIKYLKRQAMVDLHQFKHGAADLAAEAFYLHALDHPNIIKLHGVASGSIEENVASGKECGFFIVIDRLYDTLEKRIDRWRREHENDTVPLMARWNHEYHERKRRELNEKVKLALSIAEAMEYLHSLNVIFRDLKPDNIGFDKDGVLKIFDFGLAKELKAGEKKDDGRYQLTGNTGSRRYMSPEVAKEIPYDKTVDVYSFGILLWEMFSCEKPFFGYSSGKHMRQVVIGGERPLMDSQHTAHWPANLVWLLKHCWSTFPVVRPSFTQIKQVLQDILDGKDAIPADLQHRRHHSSQNDEPVEEESPPAGFGFLRRHSGKLSRSVTVPASAADHHSPRSSLAKHHHHGSEGPLSPLRLSFSSLKPAKKERSRSWVFGNKR